MCCDLARGEAADTENFEQYELLKGINSPEDLKALPRDQLPALCAEIRRYLSFRVRENGGHLASNLGVVELSVAIHRVFATPLDHVIFDVGHQSYVHKLLTGRKERFDTLREPGGISGFTKRRESVHDAFGAGHSSTAISAALGMAQADALSGSEAYTVAVVGDGALTGGLSYEALNNCTRDLRLVIIINENEMSISPNTGRLSEHLSRIRASKGYLSTKAYTARTLHRIPLIGRLLYRLLHKVKQFLKHRVYRENIFEHMGIDYRGPIDGNDLDGLMDSLECAKSLNSSVILHVKTKKGMGDSEAEANPDVYHGVAPHHTASTAQTLSGAFGEALCKLAEGDARICAITAAMSHGTGLEPFRLAYPTRFFDVGIAEGHAVTFAAGLAAGGKRPVVAVYSTFLQRAYDNILHDAALQGLPVVLAVDRAGFNERDGVTHHGIYDVSLLLTLPDIHIFTPVTGCGIAASLRAAQAVGNVAAIRYSCGGENEALLRAFYPAGSKISDTPTVRAWQSGDTPVLTVVTHGRIASEALAAAELLRQEGISLRILLCEYVAPANTLAKEIAPLLAGEAVVFYEEEIRTGGFGENLSSALRALGALSGRAFSILATENGFVTPKVSETAWQAAGIDRDSLVLLVQKLINKKGEMEL